MKDFESKEPNIEKVSETELLEDTELAVDDEISPRFSNNDEIEAAAVEEYKTISSFLFQDDINNLDNLIEKLGDNLGNIDEEDNDRVNFFEKLIIKIEEIKTIRESFLEPSNITKDLADVKGIDDEIKKGKFIDFVKETLSGLESDQNNLSLLQKKISLDELMVLQTFIQTIKSEQETKA